MDNTAVSTRDDTKRPKSAVISGRVPPATYDDFYRVATAKRMTVSEALRKLIDAAAKGRLHF